MNKSTILIFLSLCIYISASQAYGMLSYIPTAVARKAVDAGLSPVAAAQARAAAGQGAAAAQPLVAPKPQALLPDHITRLALEAQNGGDRRRYHAAVKKYLEESGDVDAVNGIPDMDYTETQNNFYFACQHAIDADDFEELNKIGDRQVAFLNAWDRQLNPERLARYSRETLLHSAARTGDEALATMLIAHRATVDVRCYAGKTPLLYAMWTPSEDTQDAKSAIIKMLLDAGADTSVITPSMNTISGSCNFDAKGANLIAGYIITRQEQTEQSLSQALKTIKGMEIGTIKQPIHEFLFSNLIAEDKNKKIFQEFKWAIIASVRAPVTINRQKLNDAFVFCNLPLFQLKDETGYTLSSLAEYVQARDLHFMIGAYTAKEQSTKETMAQFHKKTLATEQAAQKDQLKRAALAGHAQAITKINDVQILNARFNDNKTALILAATEGHVQIVDALLTKKADPACLDDNFNSALWYATQYGHTAVVERILRDIPLQGMPALMLREITKAHELAQKKEQEAVIHKELYKQIKELLIPYLTQGQAAAQ